MKPKTANEIRQAFLEFFEEFGHTKVASSSLVPGNDPTLLFANSGMVQFKDTFLGLEQRPYRRAATSQKCLRVSGKHNDLDEVGPSPRHHTFFEMLGNFSFGDYFKEDAIRFAWRLLTEVFQLPKERLWVSIFQGNAQVPPDQEAEDLWVKVGVPRERVLRFGEKDNFWQMGDTGPCGPCSEIHYYQGDDPDHQVPSGVNSDDNDYMEIWNLVFMQYSRDANGVLTPLPRPSIDTGMGFERITAVLQGVRNNYQTDLFTPIIARLIELTGQDQAHYEAHSAAYHAVADHTRSCTFLIADGILPGNEGRSYVLRRILRRAAYQGRKIGLEKPFLAETAQMVIDQMGQAYPELVQRRDFILESLTDEEVRFGRTISTGLILLDQALAQLPPAGTLAGTTAFTLYDEKGFPFDLTERIAADRGFQVDHAGFAQAMEEQRTRGRAAAQFKRNADAAIWSEIDLPPTVFVGYEALHSPATVLALIANGDVASTASAGQQVQIVLDRTPFYAESGGQVGDTGTLRGLHGVVQISETLKPLPGVSIHYGVVESGQIERGATLTAEVDAERRRDIMRNHTATHLLHRALRDVLGEHAAQAGSLVAPDRLRFDFTHNKPITAEQLHQIEQRVNRWVRADGTVSWNEMGYQEALDRGAIALFGEKYGDRVRVVAIQRGADAELGFASRDSVELCGGTHVQRTGEIGYTRIVSEGGVAAGVRRIEALTGRGAAQLVESQASILREAAAKLSVPPAQLLERLDGVLAELKQRQQELNQFRTEQARGSLDQVLANVTDIAGVRTVVARVTASDTDQLRQMGDWLRDKLGSGIVVLGTVLGDKPMVLAMVTKDLAGTRVHAGNLVKSLAGLMGGGGGGRPDMAQAGGRDVEKLDQALAAVPDLIG
jgi:alanyl-tRNA synthetase